jgi:hypothetical protein
MRTPIGSEPGAGPQAEDGTDTSPATASVRVAFHEELRPGRRAALLSWLAFTATFTGVRVLTHSIREGQGPFHNMSVGKVHLHHYMWGIGLISGVGGIAVRGEHPHHPVLACAYGTGMALIVDEFALLLDLEDVYWARQGRISVDLGVGTIALAGSYFAGLPLWQRLRRDRLARTGSTAPRPA